MESSTKKIYIIAGEASGDLHGSGLIRELKLADPQVQIRAWGGDLMQEAGAKIVKHYKELAFMGFSEVIMNIRTILNNIKWCKKDILDFAPDALVLIDYPGFNLRIAEFAFTNNIPVHYYISPQVWAWKEARVKKMKKFINKLYTILPFESEFFTKHNYEVEYVGHPLLEKIKETKTHTIVTKKKQILLMPGSRNQEVKKILPALLAVVQNMPQHQYHLAIAPSLDFDPIREQTISLPIVCHLGNSHELLRQVDYALVASGTATLETALSNVPQLVCYKTSAFNYFIGKMVIKIKYISLVNLILDKLAVKELIQGDCNGKKISTELKTLMDPKNTKECLDNYSKLREKLKTQGGTASYNVANSILAHTK